MKAGHFRLRRRGDLFARSREAPLGYLEFAGWMAQGVLWVDGWLTSGSQESLEVTLKVGGDELPAVKAERFCYSRPDLAKIPGATGQVLVLPLERPEGDGRRIDALDIRHNGGWYRWTSRRGKPIQTDLVARLRHKLTLLPEIRQELGCFVADRCARALTLDVTSDPLFHSHASTFQHSAAAFEAAEGATVEGVEEHLAEDGEEQIVEDGEEQIAEDGEEQIAEDGEERAAEDGEEQVAEDGEERAAEDGEEQAVAGGEDQTAEVGGAAEEAGGDGDQAAGETAATASPPPFMANPAEPLGLCIDAVVATEGESFFVKGWIWDVYGVVEELEMVGPGGERRDLLGSLVRTERPDVTELFRPEFGDRAEGRHGFFGFFETGLPQGDQRRYRFELRLSDGGSLAAGTPTLITGPFAGRDVVFGSLPEMRHRDLELFADQIHPAHERIRSRCRSRVAVSRSFEYGPACEAPAISLVIPVFEHVELVEHQLAQLADDPGLGDCEVIFVLDERRHEAWLEAVAFHLSRLYRISIRGIVLSHRGGHAVATNAGAAQARGRLLILMHADVFPDRPCWLEAMVDFYESRPEIGVLAPKLMYEDQSVRHAGLYFAKGLEPDDLWSNARFFQGLPRRYPAAEIARRVPAVSGACMMIRRDLFHRLGGLRDVYFGTDCEDADLCLRCAEEGLDSWYLPSVELFHLEGLSSPSDSDWRRNPWTRLYDRWLRDHRWDEKIRAMMKELGETDTAALTP